MRTFVPLLLVLIAATPVLADEPKVQRGIPYVEPMNERQMLDVYAPASGKNMPVLFWIHGGGWRRGDKADVHNKPKAFTEKGFVLVSINYRFVPNVTVDQIASDIAKAIRWTHDNAKDYGGDPNTIIVAGHSAGAQLAALVCTDDRYLKAEKLSLSIIKACIPVDGDTYDVPLQIKTVDEKRAKSYRMTFGDEVSQKNLSSVSHAAKAKNIPPFLILHVADHPETKMQSHRLVKVLQGAGISAKAFPAEGKNHTTINTNLGLPDDPATRATFAFLGDVLRKPIAGPVNNGLQLSLATNTTEVLIKDGKISAPTTLKLNFTNVSEKPIRFNTYDFSWSRIKGEVKASPAGAVTVIRLAADRKIRNPVAGDFFEIKPRQTWSPGDMPVFPGVFPQSVGSKIVYQIVGPGEFRVRFTYHSSKIDSPFADGIWTGELVSNELVIIAKK